MDTILDLLNKHPINTIYCNIPSSSALSHLLQKKTIHTVGYGSLHFPHNLPPNTKTLDLSNINLTKVDKVIELLYVQPLLTTINVQDNPLPLSELFELIKECPILQSIHAERCLPTTPDMILKFQNDLLSLPPTALFDLHVEPIKLSLKLRQHLQKQRPSLVELTQWLTHS